MIYFISLNSIQHNPLSYFKMYPLIFLYTTNTLRNTCNTKLYNAIFGSKIRALQTTKSTPTEIHFNFPKIYTDMNILPNSKSFIKLYTISRINNYSCIKYKKFKTRHEIVIRW